MTYQTERALCTLLNHDMAGAEGPLFEWAPEPWDMQVNGPSVVERLLELSEESNDPDDKHRWWELVPTLAEKKGVQLRPKHWYKALDVLWRNQGIDEQNRIKGIHQLKKVAPRDLDWGGVARVASLIPHGMRSDALLQALVDIGMDKDQVLEDRWDGVKESPKIPSKFKELFSPVWLFENQSKDPPWTEGEWQGLWWRTKWLADQSLNKKTPGLDSVSPSLQDRNTALLKWAKARGSTTNDLFLAIDSAWDVNTVLDRVSTWSVATRKTQALVWSIKDDEGTPLWMNALARHPTLLQSTEQTRMKGFWAAVDWEVKDHAGRDGLAYVEAGILSGVKTKEASALWDVACAKAGLVPVVKESEKEKHEKERHREQLRFLQMMLASYKKNPEAWGDDGFIVSPDGESYNLGELIALFKEMPKGAKFTKEKNPCGEILLPNFAFESKHSGKYEEYDDHRPHPHEGAWKSRLGQAVEVALKWSTVRVSHPVPVEVVFRRGDEIAKPTWEDVKPLLPKLVQASFESQNWEWLNPDVGIGIKDLELAVQKQPELVNWAGGYTLWKLMYPKSAPKEEGVERMRAIKSWIEVGLDCEKWGEMLTPKFAESERSGMYNVTPVKKWWAEEVQPLWERQRLKEHVGLPEMVKRETPAL